MSLEFGCWLRERLRDRYLAEIDVARMVGASPSLVRQWVDGQREPSDAADVRVLAEMLGVPIEDVNRHLAARRVAADGAMTEAAGEMARLQAAFASDLDELPAAFRQAVVEAQAKANAQPATDEA